MISEIEKEYAYKLLKQSYKYNTAQCRQIYRCFEEYGDLKFIELPLSVLKNSKLKVTQYRQAKILKELLEEKRIIIKYGHKKRRYFTIQEEE